MCDESQVEKNSSDHHEIQVSRCDRDRVNIHEINGYDVNGVNGNRVSWHGTCRLDVGAVVHCDRVGVDGVGVNWESTCEYNTNRVDGSGRNWAAVNR